MQLVRRLLVTRAFFFPAHGSLRVVCHSQLSLCRGLVFRGDFEVFRLEDSRWLVVHDEVSKLMETGAFPLLPDGHF